jgi:hypothetical protein
MIVISPISGPQLGKVEVVCLGLMGCTNQVGLFLRNFGLLRNKSFETLKTHVYTSCDDPIERI